MLIKGQNFIRAGESGARLRASAPRDVYYCDPGGGTAVGTEQGRRAASHRAVHSIRQSPPPKREKCPRGRGPGAGGRGPGDADARGEGGRGAEGL